MIEELHATLEGAGLALTGKHHEIYLSDFRRTAPEKLRVILRQPGACGVSQAPNVGRFNRPYVKLCITR